MKWIICAVLAMGLFGQEKPTEQKKPNQDSYEAEIITVKNLSGDSFNRLVVLLRPIHDRYQADEKLRTIIVYGPPNIVAQMRKVVEQLDRPGSEAARGKNIEGTITFLKCSTQTTTGGTPLPTDMESVARQLKAATSCKNVELWDSLPVHLQEGKESRFDLTRPTPNMTALTKITVRATPDAVLHKDSSRYVRFSKLEIYFKIPYTTGPTTAQMFQYMDVGIDTAGDFKEGQKTVLGKLTGPENDTAIFAVVTLKVLD